MLKTKQNNHTHIHQRIRLRGRMMNREWDTKFAELYLYLYECEIEEYPHNVFAHTHTHVIPVCASLILWVTISNHVECEKGTTIKGEHTVDKQFLKTQTNKQTHIHHCIRKTVNKITWHVISDRKNQVPFHSWNDGWKTKSGSNF